MYDNKELSNLLPHPSAEVNKYSRGKLTLLVGSRTYPGAAGLAALASQRMGAGYTEVYSEDSVVSQVQMFHPSLVVKPWSAWDPSCLKPTKHPTAYVIGCGFDEEDPYVSGLMRRLLKVASSPVVVDGGALRLLSARKIRDLCEQRFHKGLATVVTPHGGEANMMARAMGIELGNPESMALGLSRAYGAVTVLKGPDTYISDGERVFCMQEGTAALAKAGTGDVLAGMLGALLAQKLSPLDACVLATTLHARAGMLAAEKLGDISVCAEDVIAYLPAAILHTEELAKKHEMTIQSAVAEQVAREVAQKLQDEE